MSQALTEHITEEDAVRMITDFENQEDCNIYYSEKAKITNAHLVAYIFERGMVNKGAEK